MMARCAPFRERDSRSLSFVLSFPHENTCSKTKRNMVQGVWRSPMRLAPRYHLVHSGTLRRGVRIPFSHVKNTFLHM